MCGIVGYVGSREVIPILLDGLRMVEYRGYDSSGICLQTPTGLHIIKRAGRISDLAKEVPQLTATLGIGHTRWATHGEPTEINAHPHTDCTKRVAVVHNGIIENYAQLKEQLNCEGHVFTSDTDSEVLSHLIEKELTADATSGDVLLAVKKALLKVDGSFGLAVLFSRENRIIAARRGSPVILGIGTEEMFVASDAAALLPYTKDVVYLEDNQVADIHASDYTVTTLNGGAAELAIHRLQGSISETERGGFKHFMQKEIMEQPQAISNTLRGRVTESEVKISILAKEVQRVILVACGSARNTCLFGKQIIENLAGIPTSVEFASEFRYANPVLSSRTLVVAVSQSGETADTLAAIREAKTKGSQTLAIINVVGSSISREVDSGIYLHAGPEISVASTKAVSCMLTSLVLLALHLSPKQDARVITALCSLSNAVQETLACAPVMQQVAESIAHCTSAFFLGRGLHSAIAFEGAIKLKEISYIHAEGFPAAEMKHGPIALLQKGFPVVVMIPNDELYLKNLSNIQECKARGATIIAITTRVDPELNKLAEHVIIVPEIIPELQPILSLIPLQLLAYHVALAKGLDVDKPRNLAKSVTVE